MSRTFRAFASRFCETFGAGVEEREGRLHVALPPELAAHFGREALVWTFTPHDPTGELVAYGSRAFEEMLAWLGGHGRLAAVRLPERAEAPPPAPVALAGTVETLETTREDLTAHVFNFQLAFSCDERVERLFTVCLDGAARERPDMLAWLEASGAAGEAVMAASPPPEVLRVAEDRAAAAAEAWVGPMEVQALQRLTALGERLVAYYEAQMREVPIRRRRGQTDEEAVAEAEELRWQLRRELERKLRDETARHQMRVQVRRISQAYVEVPGTRYGYRLVGTRGARELAVWQNRHTGEVVCPACDRCGEPAAAFGLCVDGHLACERCFAPCPGCGADHCQAELVACENCGRAGCAGCRATCASGHFGCAAHLEACPGCGQALCPRCERPHGCGFERG